MQRLTEALWAAGIGVAAVALFLATYSSRVSLADAPESVSGIRSLGILHAPGYPSYAAAGRLLTGAMAVGSWSARVNLFSVVCAAATIAILFLLARRFGASRIGAAVGAFAVATGLSYWFYASYAKHYAFSGLVVVAAALLATSWQELGGRWRLIVAAGLLGVGMGSSWQLAMIMLAGITTLLVMGERRLKLLDLVAPGLVFVVVTVGVGVYVIVRARQHPDVNWGEVTNVGRLLNLVIMSDFRIGQAPAPGPNALTHAPGRFFASLVVIVREMGVLAFALALFGAYVVARRHHRSHSAFLLVVFVLNVVAVVFAAGLDHQAGLQSGLIVGGFLLNAFFVLGICIAIGTTDLVRIVSEAFDNSRRRPRRW